MGLSPMALPDLLGSRMRISLPGLEGTLGGLQPKLLLQAGSAARSVHGCSGLWPAGSQKPAEVEPGQPHQQPGPLLAVLTGQVSPCTQPDPLVPACVRRHLAAILQSCSTEDGINWFHGLTPTKKNPDNSECKLTPGAVENKKHHRNSYWKSQASDWAPSRKLEPDRTFEVTALINSF